MKQFVQRICMMILLITSIASCKSKLQPIKTITEMVKDSISTKLITVDTLQVLRASDTVKINTLISKLSEVPIIQKSKHTQVSLRKVGNTIEAECIADELRAIIELQKEMITHYKEVNRQQTETIVEYKKFVPFFTKALAWIGGIVVLTLIVVIAITIFNSKRP